MQTSNLKTLVWYGSTVFSWDTLKASPLSSSPSISTEIVDGVDIPVVETATWYSELGRTTFGAITV